MFIQKNWISWLLLIIWCVAIYSATALPQFTGENTEKIIENSIEFSKEHEVSKTLSSTINFAIRKSTHFIVYGVLALLFFNVLTPFIFRYYIAWGLTTVYAITDEWHQSFVPNRSGNVNDVILDAMGAFIFLLGVVWRKKWKEHKGN